MDNYNQVSYKDIAAAKITTHSSSIRQITLIPLVTEKMLTTIKVNKPKLVRVQHNPSNGLYFLTIPLETIQECNWEAGDYVKFKLIDDDHLQLERVR